MFTSILNNTTSSLTVIQVSLLVLTGIVCGVLVALGYKWFTQSSTSFLLTIAAMPVLVCFVILMVNGNLGVGIAVAGSFSLVRFRSLPGKSSDIGVIFFAMGIGLALGMGHILFALYVTILVLVLTAVLIKSNLFVTRQSYRYVTVQVPEELNVSQAFQDLFAKYTYSTKLLQIRTVHMGMLYELAYEVQLKDNTQEQELINQLRTRNGNLQISSSVHAPQLLEL